MPLPSCSYPGMDKQVGILYFSLWLRQQWKKTHCSDNFKFFLYYRWMAYLDGLLLLLNLDRQGIQINCWFRAMGGVNRVCLVPIAEKKQSSKTKEELTLDSTCIFELEGSVELMQPWLLLEGEEDTTIHCDRKTIKVNPTFCLSQWRWYPWMRSPKATFQDC